MNNIHVPERLVTEYMAERGFHGFKRATLHILEVLRTNPEDMRAARVAYKRLATAWRAYQQSLPFPDRFDRQRGEMRINSRGSVRFVTVAQGGRSVMALPAAYEGVSVPLSEITAAVSLPRWVEFRTVGNYAYLLAKESASQVQKDLMAQVFAYSVHLDDQDEETVDTYDAMYAYRHLTETFIPTYRARLRDAYRQRQVTTPHEHLPRGERNQKQVPPVERQKRLEKYLSERREKVTPVDLSQFVIPGHGTLSSRNWGIEVESGGARSVYAPSGWDRKYDSSLSSAYVGLGEGVMHPGDAPERPDGHNALHTQSIHHHGEDGNGPCQNDPNPNYVPESDCAECDDWRDEYEQWERDLDEYNNYDSDEGDGDDCAEFVSPILHSFHSKGLEKVVSELSQNPQNNSAGIHVHVDASDLTAQQIGGLVYGYNVIEPLLEDSYRREVRNYCKVRPISEVFHIQESIANGVDPRRNALGDRYVSLNVNSLVSHGTIEFRAMGPVYDYEYLVRWAYLCRELVNAAKNGATRRDYMAIHNFDDLKAFLIRFGQESVDNALSLITDEDIEQMGEMNENLYRAESVFAAAGGEI